MKEFIPAPRPEEINRRAFCKTFEKGKSGEWEYFSGVILPGLGKLESKGLVPETVAISERKNKAYVYMQRVNGFELAKFPPKYEVYKFSLDFAQKAASLFEGLFEAGYYHEDAHWANIMFDIVGNRCVAIDLDSLRFNNDHNTPLKKYINDYAELMSNLYLGSYSLDVAIKLLDEGELQQVLIQYGRLFHARQSLQRRYHPKMHDFLVESDMDSLALSELMRSDKLTSKVNPAVKDFILRGLNPATCPDSFDEILGLEAEASEKI